MGKAPTGFRLDQHLEEGFFDVSQINQGHEAIILNSPATASADCFVRLINQQPISNTYQVGPCPFAPHPVAGGGILLPQAGNRALVIISDDSQAWIACWWPY